LPEELYNLDILDGSPPCSTFSTAGSREKAWGKEKVFREGQKKQTLDDLFFVFLDTVEKLKPKIVIAENVVGLIKGNAKGYVNAIIKKFYEIGYDVQLFKLNAALMDVPQARERVFFIANNQNYKKLKLDFNGKPILFGEVRTEQGANTGTELQKRVLLHNIQDCFSVEDINKKIGKSGGYTNLIIWDDRICNTITSNGQIFRAIDKLGFCKQDFVNVSSFPQDYDFGKENAKYICGMSVPPNMMANIAIEIWNQWLKCDFDEKAKN